MNIVIIDTGCANLSSVQFAIERLGYEVTVSSEPAVLKKADKLFLPGVGTAREAMRNLAQRDLISQVSQLEKPVLGICLGMQLLGSVSQEDGGQYLGDTSSQVNCLGLVPAPICKMQVADLRLPHMGWNQVTPVEGHPLFKDIPAGSYFYFVHSYAMPVNPYTIASCDYGNGFTAAVGKDNFYGVQFHPERSGQAGAQLIKNFLEM